VAVACWLAARAEIDHTADGRGGLHIRGILPSELLEFYLANILNSKVQGRRGCEVGGCSR
jgi:hypothetical protein